MTRRKSQTKKLTEEQIAVVKNFRKMWNWIADETEKRNKTVNKWEYFEDNLIPVDDRPEADCYLCEIVGDHGCECCPVNWGFRYCGCDGSPYHLWYSSWRLGEVHLAAKYARIIANLPLKEGVKEYE